MMFHVKHNFLYMYDVSRETKIKSADKRIILSSADDIKISTDQFLSE